MNSNEEAVGIYCRTSTWHQLPTWICFTWCQAGILFPVPKVPQWHTQLQKLSALLMRSCRHCAAPSWSTSIPAARHSRQTEPTAILAGGDAAQHPAAHIQPVRPPDTAPAWWEAAVYFQMSTGRWLTSVLISYLKTWIAGIQSPAEEGVAEVRQQHLATHYRQAEGSIVRTQTECYPDMKAQILYCDRVFITLWLI